LIHEITNRVLRKYDDCEIKELTPSCSVIVFPGFRLIIKATFDYSVYLEISFKSNLKIYLDCNLEVYSKVLERNAKMNDILTFIDKVRSFMEKTILVNTL